MRSTEHHSVLGQQNITQSWDNRESLSPGLTEHHLVLGQQNIKYSWALSGLVSRTSPAHPRCPALSDNQTVCYGATPTDTSWRGCRAVWNKRCKALFSSFWAVFTPTIFIVTYGA